MEKVLRYASVFLKVSRLLPGHPLRDEFGEYPNFSKQYISGPTFNFQVVDDKLLRGGAIDYNQLKELQNLGVTHILSLDAEAGKHIAPACKALGISHTIIPIQEATPAIIKSLAKEMAMVKERPGVTYVHCRYGKDRTGMAAAVYNILNGKPIEEAINEQANKHQMGWGLPEDQQEEMKAAIRVINDSLPEDEFSFIEEEEGENIFNNPQQQPKVARRTW